MKRNIDNWWTRLGILTVVLLLYAACWFGIPFLIELDKDGSWSTRGQFGDMFGTVNALFSGLAFAGIIYTILLQREELKAQREELELTRKELKGQKEELRAQRKEFKKQNTTLKRQRFESTFFNMLTIHFKILDSLSFGELRGLMALSQIMALCENRIEKYERNISKEPHKSEEFLNIFKEEYTNFSDTTYLVTSSYVQSIVQLYRTIKDSQFPQPVEDRYFLLLRSYLSKVECMYLYYYIPYSGIQDLTDLDSKLQITKDAISFKFNQRKLPI